MPKPNYDVIVIGGGASGLMAAGFAASRGRQTLLLEKNGQLGKKLKITGGGRCNLTNAESDTRKFLSHYGPAEPFLYSAFSQFGVVDTMKFFTQLGLPLVTEARQRVFPASQSALDVFNVLKDYVHKNNVTVKTSAKVLGFESTGDQITGVVTDRATYTADSFILATGGMSHPETGSTGDGFGWLKDLGHTVVKPSPTVVPLAARNPWVHALSGVTLSFMKITFFVDGKKAFSKTGKLLFTHFGLSGPLILNSAKQVADILEAGEVTAHIDCFPDTDLGSLENRILKIFDANKNKILKNVFDQIAPHGTDSVLLSLLRDLDSNKNVHSITKEERKRIVRLLKALPVNITGLMGHDRAVVTDGGVPLTEIDTKTMRSRRFKNLFVTGDLLHINRPSGGFSLQLCWTTGYLAGHNA